MNFSTSTAMLLLVFSIDYCHIVSSDVLFINALIYECVKSMQNMSPHMTEEYICIFVAVTCMHACMLALWEVAWIKPTRPKSNKTPWYYLTPATDLQCVFIDIFYKVIINLRVDQLVLVMRQHWKNDICCSDEVCRSPVCVWWGQA